MEKQNKIAIIINIIFFLICLLISGLSYALWTISHLQVNKNIVQIACFKTTFEDANPITLSQVFPISNSDGMKLKPYTFTITNTCTQAASFQINNETLNSSTIGAKNIKMAINNSYQKLSDYPGATATIVNASYSNQLSIGFLGANESASYEVRLWLDQDTTTAEAQSSSYESKIVVISTPTSNNNKLLSYVLKNNEGGSDTIENKTPPELDLAPVTQEEYDNLSEAGQGCSGFDKGVAVVEQGMWTTTDDYGTSYYYRGSVINNNVLFANFCWKIIRINGDGTIRLIYNGNQTSGVCDATETAAQIGESEFNNQKDDNAYVGYMYGSTGSTSYDDTHANTNSSTIKTFVDNWYQNNLLTYAEKLSDAVFCNDRSLNSGLGTSNQSTYYSTSNRTGQTSSLRCPNQHDRFTVNDTTIGNGNLTYPIGMITKDEVEFAGLKISGSRDISSNYLNTDVIIWTMSPSNYYKYMTYYNYAENYSFSGYNGDNSEEVYNKRGVRPVINLKANTLYNGGAGTTANPYKID